MEATEQDPPEKFRPERPRKSKRDNVIALRPRRADNGDRLLEVPKEHTPLIPEGRYFGLTKTIRKMNMRGFRDYYLVTFDVWSTADGMSTGEVPVAYGIPGFFNLGGSAGSKWARLLRLLCPGKKHPVERDVLKRYVEVRVETVERNYAEEKVPKTEQWSRVAEVLALA